MDISDPHVEHRKRLRKIQGDALAAVVGMCTSLLSIYWTVTHGLPFKTYFFEGTARVIVVLTALIYIFAQRLALSNCFLRWKISGRTLRLDLERRRLLMQDEKSPSE
ncbi:hypothetical protein [Duganella sp. Leaf126]|uniref:hypothetical protein n=1 Tax=Duganella sp. Leaf126 TaxID=1736266 RepID=UPI0012E2AB8A|nr:hypothetical protein [Duganella sp. Leaf126]